MVGFFVFAGTVDAATRTWTGASSANWNVAGNWTEGLPEAGDDLVFPAGASNLVTNNDFPADTAFNTITLSGGGYTLAGNSVSITTSVTDSNTTGTNIISLIMTGAGSVTKSGAGTLTLSGTNTFTGGVTLSAGQLNINNAQALGTVAGTFTINGGTIDNTSGASITTLNYPMAWNGDFTFAGTRGLNFGTGAVTPNASRTITCSGSADYTLAIGGVISGAIDLTKTGTGKLRLFGVNTYTGITTILAGVLAISTTDAPSGSPGALGNSTSDVLLGGTSGSSPAYLVISGARNIGRNITVQTGSSGNVYLFGSDTSSSIVFSGNITLNKNVYLYSNAANVTTTFSGIISGDYGINTAGNLGTVILSGANTYTGATTISAGTLQLGAAGDGTNGPLGTVAGATSITSGAVLDLNGYSLSTAEPLTINGTGISSGGALINSSSTAAQSATYSGLLTLGSHSSIVANYGIKLTNAGTITGSGYNLTLSGSGTGTASSSIASIIGTGAGTVTKDGTGAWSLSGTNTFTGGVTLNTGQLNINNSAALGTVAGTFTINGGTIDNTTGATITTLNYPMAWNGDFTFAGTKSLNLGSGAVTPNASRIITVDGSDSTYLQIGGVIGGGAIDLTKTGDSILRLSGANTYTGVTTVLAGYLGAVANAPSGAPGAFGNSTSDILLGDTSGSSFAILYISGAYTIGRNITVRSGSSGIVSIYGTQLASNIYSGNIILNKNIRLYSNTANGTTTFSGAISGEYGINTINNSGTVVLSGNNTYTGGTTHSAGTLTAGHTNALGTGAFTMSAGTFNGGTDLTIGGNTTISGGTFNAPSGTLSVAGNWNGTGATVNPGSGTVTFNGSGAQIATSSGQLFNTVTVTNASAGGVTFADRLQAATLTDTTDGSTLKFAAATEAEPHTITTALNLTGGASGITLAPSVAETTWYLSAPDPTTVTNVTVSYSNSTNHITPVTSTDGGNNVNWDFPVAPTVSASSASGVTDTAATLNGSVDDAGYDTITNRGFEWGTDTSYGTIVNDAGSYGAGAFTSNLTGLTCATSYHFRSFATNSAGTASSTDESFTTSECPVTASDPTPTVGSSSGGRSIFSLIGLLSNLNIPTTNPAPSIMENIKDIVSNLIIPSQEGESISEEKSPEPVSLSLEGGWKIINPSFIQNFILAPLPKQLTDLTDKYPELDKIFTKLGVTNISDLSKLQGTSVSLPVVSNLKDLPTEVLAVKTSNNKVDMVSIITLDETGKVEQRVETTANQNLTLAVKPIAPVDAVNGYLIFREGARKTVAELAVNLQTASAILALQDSKSIVNPEIPPADLLVQKFAYADTDGDGVYTADIKTPVVEGTYEIITLITYKDKDLGTKELRLITVVDPEGYVYYRNSNGDETRVSNAVVSIFNADTGMLWDAETYNQTNPQTTDATGKYSFLVPEGKYYITVEKKGYKFYQGNTFTVNAGPGVHFNIELKNSMGIPWLDWKTAFFILVIMIISSAFAGYALHEHALKRKLMRRS